MTPPTIRPLTEAQWQTRVMDTARAHGWRVVHIRAARARSGRTAVPYEGDPGLPDLILARAGTVLLAELKPDTRWRWQPGQRDWLDAAGHHGALWKPADWPAVVRTLSAGQRWCLDAPCRYCAPDDIDQEPTTR